MKILVVSPHPDDAEIGCGASINKWVRTDHDVDIAIVSGHGDLKMVHSNATIPFTQRITEQREAAKVLGVKGLHFLDAGPASRLDTVSLANIVTKLDVLLTDQSYDRLLIPLPSYNQDHKVVWNACLAATRPGRVDKLDIYAYEQAMQGFGEQISGPMQGVAYSIVCRCDVQAKVASMLCHTSQIRGREDSLSGTTGAVALARLRGLEKGVEYAELFYPIRIEV